MSVPFLARLLATLWWQQNLPGLHDTYQPSSSLSYPRSQRVWGHSSWKGAPLWEMRVRNIQLWQDSESQTVQGDQGRLPGRSAILTCTWQIYRKWGGGNRHKHGKLSVQWHKGEGHLPCGRTERSPVWLGQQAQGEQQERTHWRKGLGSDRRGLEIHAKELVRYFNV